MSTRAASVLPRSLDPLAQESLPGFILRLAHRLGHTPARIAALTALDQSSAFPTMVPYHLLIRLSDEARASFAAATRLTLAEVADLTLNTLGDRYLLPDTYVDRLAHSRVDSDPWLSAPATRYCPLCLAGDGSAIQNAHGGPWRKTWYLSVVFACTHHRVLLAERCPSCQHPVHWSRKESRCRFCDTWDIVVRCDGVQQRVGAGVSGCGSGDCVAGGCVHGSGVRV
ncbi:TniQ family protein [Nonomuraea sp. NPDC049695]|uniref:TniQ family protein n=1 Tax=Nonomuraea sp. NPDC049695 TaxID=3154734 RepID=UPI0034470410